MTKHRFVEHLDDLIHPEDYPSDPQGRRVRLRIRTTEDGVEVLADAMRPAELEKLLEELDPEAIEQMLCG
jgi:hypothetical protein